VARAQREHAVAALHASVTRFTSDFDTRLLEFTLRLRFRCLAKVRHGRCIAISLSKWRELAPYPRLISQVKAVESDPRHAPFQVSARGVQVSSRSGGHGEVTFTAGGPPSPGGVAFQSSGGVGVSSGPAIESSGPAIELVGTQEARRKTWPW